MDLMKKYVQTILEYNQKREDAELFSNELENDIISISEYMEAEFMEKDSAKVIELLTVISLTDNPTLDLSAAQPSKYKVEHTILGTGIMCYKGNALQILNKQLEPNEKIVKIKVKICKDDILDLCSTRHKKYLRDVYNTITNKEKIKTDTEFMNYVCKKGTTKFSMVTGLYMLGKPLYEGSSIVDYMEKAFLIRNTDIIISAEEMK